MGTTGETLLTHTLLTIRSADLNGESTLPSIATVKNVQQQTKSLLDEDDELFVGFGFMDNSFPYRQQNCYSRELKETKQEAFILENDFLKATFLPDFGGRLWSLFDKVANKELTFENPVIRPGNLAIRNAWLSGGVEWNCGMVGHHPFTCSRIFTATTALNDGTPVLRMYEFERIRRCVYQMDFFLPKDSKVLFTRMRIVNPNKEVVPMYWWSNIAVPSSADARVIMATNETYTNRDNMVSKTSVPMSGDIDITYPCNNPHAIDFFWKIKPEVRKYVCQLNKDGYGLIQTSTKRLKGRKLFVWGMGPGGERWQEFLSTKENGGRYAEIQAGIAHTQYECLPMPPLTAWEWLEAYGAMSANSQKVHGDWEDAKAEVSERLSELVDEAYMETLLKETHAMATSPAKETILKGAGWGALERERRSAVGGDELCPHLDFGKTDAEQEAWLHLLKNGYFPEVCPCEAPKSWMLQPEWTVMLERAVNGMDSYNWYAWLQLGMVYLASREPEKAKHALEKSMQLKPSAWGYYGLANIARLEEKLPLAAELALRAASIKPDDASLAKEALRLLTECGFYDKAVAFAALLSPEIASIGRIKLYLAFSYLNVGNLEMTEEILFENGGIVVPDVREGENSVTDLWFELEEKKAKRDGREFNRETAEPPALLDFRMGAVKKKK